MTIRAFRYSLVLTLLAAAASAGIGPQHGITAPQTNGRSTSFDVAFEGTSYLVAYSGRRGHVPVARCLHQRERLPDYRMQHPLYANCLDRPGCDQRHGHATARLVHLLAGNLQCRRLHVRAASDSDQSRRAAPPLVALTEMCRAITRHTPGRYEVNARRDFSSVSICSMRSSRSSASKRSSSDSATIALATLIASPCAMRRCMRSTADA
jgi:hypothetical protein